MRRAAFLLLPIVMAGLLAASALAQAPARRLTTIEGLRRFPNYYHLQNVLVRGSFVETDGRVSLRADDQDIAVALGDGVRALSGVAEVRGLFLDIGRLEPGDPRLAGTSRATDVERWPLPGQELVLAITSATGAPQVQGTSVRAVALEPWRFEGEPVTLVGQFRGRNLLADLPGAPARSPYDFVLRATDGAIWVTGRRPRGQGFDLSVDARVDTGRWLAITGRVIRAGGLVMVEASGIALTEEPAVTDAASDDDVAPPPAPIDVVFSTPVAGEREVSPDVRVRIQVSRGIAPDSVDGRVRAVRVAPGGAAVEPLEVRTSYDATLRAIDVTFAAPLPSFATITIELLDGVVGLDGGPVQPWSLTFTVGP
ncbi:MAG: Ig-like domain-containing protein [Acidobacteria bacterium]|nr:Ig-like domain-containing protein [Acidobacteriota bacterium]